jgi:ribosomal-protein-alanine N-acetyltransferase
MIETERLLLRPYEETDLRDYFRILSDAKNMYYLNDIITHTIEEARQSLAEAIGLNKIGKARRFCVILKENNENIGSVGYDTTEITPVGKIVHMGWFAVPKHQGRGYITEAAKKMIEFGFASDGCIRITTGCFSENIPTQKVMQKIGFRKEGEFIESQWHDGKMKDRQAWAINKKELPND